MKMGRWRGQIEGLVSGCEVGLEAPYPSQWKRHHGPDGRQETVAPAAPMRCSPNASTCGVARRITTAPKRPCSPSMAVSHSNWCPDRRSSSGRRLREMTTMGRISSTRKLTRIVPAQRPRAATGTIYEDPSFLPDLTVEEEIEPEFVVSASLSTPTGPRSSTPMRPRSRASSAFSSPHGPRITMCQTTKTTTTTKRKRTTDARTGQCTP
jgi:hypothetical protein